MAHPIISLKQVTYKYKNSSDFALTNITLDFNEGEFNLLVGYSGSGKSTLLKTINGLIPNFYPGVFGGKVIIKNNDISDTSPANLANTIGFVFQNPENQLSNLTVEREIAFPLENFGVPKKEIFDRIDEVISLLKIERLRDKSPFSISGGEQQIVAVAAALALDPPILILDEATANLSPKSARDLLELLRMLNEEYNKTIIISEHRLERCIDFADIMVYIDKGRILSVGEPREVLYDVNYPIDLLPKIPQLFTSLKSQTNNFAKILPNYQKDFQNRLPLNTEDFLKLLNFVGDVND
ncbi:MAG: ATP-binding cassette domain-containing protein [Asgard group archaeon]|nr:ATP-binding cassette domain-containing protein [Asgard group archaeon]